MSKPIDYDAPRRSEIEAAEDEVMVRSAAAQSSGPHLDDADVAEVFDLPGADLPGGDLSGEELTEPVVPMQPDEFRCTRCFLVHHRSRLAVRRGDQEVCRECSS